MCPPCLALRLVCTGVRTDGVVRIIIKIYAAANNIIPIFQVPKCAVRGSLNPNGSAHTFFVVSRIENPVKRFFENNVRRSKDIKKMINRKM